MKINDEETQELRLSTVRLLESRLETKVLEIRDKGTCIPALAIRMQAKTPIQSYYIHYRSGYPGNGSSIMLMILADGKATNDPYMWGALGMGVRTMPNAHLYIEQHFDGLRDGAVVDVEYIKGETAEPKMSERLP